MNPVALAARQNWQGFWQHNVPDWLFWGKTALAALLGLWLAYRFQLDSPGTVVITVFIVMQSRNGMVLSKSFYRAIGTIVGSVVALLLVAAFPDARFGFLAGLALWVGFCTAGARYFRNFQAYAFVLAGYTAALVGVPAALDPSHAFYIWVARLSDVMLGIVVASVISAVVFPQSLEHLLRQTAQRRLQHFLQNTLRVLDGGVPRADWIVLHLEAIQETLQLDSYRSSSLFENAQSRRQDELTRQMIADMMDASGALHLLNSHIRRMQRPGLAPLYDRMKELTDQLREDFEQLQSTLQQTKAIPIHMPVQKVLERVVGQLQAMRRELRASLSQSQALALDSLILLLTRFLVEMLRYLASYDRFQNPNLEPVGSSLPLTTGRMQPGSSKAYFDRQPTEIVQPLSAALRSMLVLAAVAFFWLQEDWPSGPLALIMATIFSALFSTFPNPLSAVRQMGFGAVGAFLAALVFSLELLPRVQGFTLLALVLLPFFLIPPWLLTRTRWTRVAAGFGIFFPQLAIPANDQAFSYTQMLNTGVAELLAIFLVGIAFFLVFPVGNGWERRRLLMRLHNWVVRVASDKALPDLRSQFEFESREYLRLLAADLAPQQTRDVEALREAMRLNELAEAILQLRILLSMQTDWEHPLQRYQEQYLAPLLRIIQQSPEIPATAEYWARVRAILDAVAKLPEEKVDPALHPILPPNALFQVYVHVIASVSRRLSGAAVEEEPPHAR
ncbi:FUSC family protein [Acidithiobacillus sp. M4-SHS-6]|uniref:FUSC family protein n=1 Tax=Acidithiobacillus sp. M4-SHS-6 TaxID=3383024 RepID=UPI0039BE4124